MILPEFIHRRRQFTATTTAASFGHAPGPQFSIDGRLLAPVFQAETAGGGGSIGRGCRRCEARPRGGSIPSSLIRWRSPRLAQTTPLPEYQDNESADDKASTRQNGPIVVGTL
jgi:hypothetical protein